MRDPSRPQLGLFAASWVSWVASWEPWGALWDQFGLQLGDFVPSWKPCDANLGISWVTLFPLGSDLASFGYLVCESSFLPYRWIPLVEFVGIGEAGLDLCQCASFGGELHTTPNAHTCATCTCVHVDPLYDMRACCNKLLKTIRFKSDNGRFNNI